MQHYSKAAVIGRLAVDIANYVAVELSRPILGQWRCSGASLDLSMVPVGKADRAKQKL